MLTFVSLFVAFLGSIVGLAGNKWDPSKKGVIKLTLTGWFALAAIIIGFTVSVFFTINSNAELDYATRQREAIRKLAYEKIEHECQRALAPFVDIFIDNTMQWEDAWPAAAEILTTEQAAKTFKAFNFGQRPRRETGFDDWDQSYIEYIQGTYKNFPERLERLLVTWSQYLTAEDILALDGLAHHEYAGFLQSFAPYHGNEQKKVWSAQVGVYYPFDSYDNYNQQVDFLTKLRLLWTRTSLASRTNT